MLGDGGGGGWDYRTGARGGPGGGPGASGGGSGGPGGAREGPGDAPAGSRGVLGVSRGVTGRLPGVPEESRGSPEEAEAPSKLPKGSPGELPGCPRLQNIRCSLGNNLFFKNKQIVPGARPRLPWGSLGGVEGCLRGTGRVPGGLLGSLGERDGGVWGYLGGPLGALGGPQEPWGSSHGLPRDPEIHPPSPGDPPRTPKSSLSPTLGPRMIPKSPAALPGPLQRPPRGHPGLPELYFWTRKGRGLQRT